MLPLYRVYLTDPEGYAEAVADEVECADDAAAMRLAATYPHSGPIEVWRDGALVGKISRPRRFVQE